MAGISIVSSRLTSSIQSVCHSLNTVRKQRIRLFEGNGNSARAERSFRGSNKYLCLLDWIINKNIFLLACWVIEYVLKIRLWASKNVRLTLNFALFYIVVTFSKYSEYWVFIENDPIWIFLLLIFDFVTIHSHSCVCYLLQRWFVMWMLLAKMSVLFFIINISTK